MDARKFAGELVVDATYCGEVRCHDVDCPGLRVRWSTTKHSCGRWSRSAASRHLCPALACSPRRPARGRTTTRRACSGWPAAERVSSQGARAARVSVAIATLALVAGCGSSPREPWEDLAAEPNASIVSDADSATSTGLVLAEIGFDPGPGDPQFIEIANAGPDPVELADLRLEADGRPIEIAPEGSTVASGERLLVVLDGPKDPESQVVHVAGELGRADGNVRLLDADQRLMDSVVWGPGQAGAVSFAVGDFVPASVEPGTTIGRAPGADQALSPSEWVTTRRPRRRRVRRTRSRRSLSPPPGRRDPGRVRRDARVVPGPRRGVVPGPGGDRDDVRRARSWTRRCPSPRVDVGSLGPGHTSGGSRPSPRTVPCRRRRRSVASASVRLRRGRRPPPSPRRTSPSGSTCRSSRSARTPGCSSSRSRTRPATRTPGTPRQDRPSKDDLADQHELCDRHGRDGQPLLRRRPQPGPDRLRDASRTANRAPRRT